MSIDELRETLSDQVRVIQSGDGDLDVADSLANMVGKILKSVALEISYAEHKSRGGQMIDMMEKVKK